MMAAASPLAGEDIQDIIEHVNEGHVPELLHCVRAFTDIAAPTHAQITAVYAHGADFDIEVLGQERSRRFIAFSVAAPPHAAIRATVAQAMQQLSIKDQGRAAQWTVRENVRLTGQFQRLTLDLGTDERRDWAPGYACRFDVPGHEHGRPYTLRSVQGTQAVVDIYCHGTGLGSRWAQAAQPGQAVTVRGGRREGFPDFTQGPVWLLGDETALPTIAALLDSWPHETPVQAVLEVGEDSEHRYLDDVCLPHHCRVSWVRKGQESGTALLERLQGLSGRPAAVWGALEVAAAKSLRRQFAEAFPEAEVRLTGYWRLGESG